MLSVEHATLISGDHILDVDESIFSTVELKALECWLNKIAKVLAFSLAVIDLVSKINVLCFHKVEYWEDLSVVWNESLTDSVRALHQALQDLKGDSNDFWIAGVQSN